MKTLYVVGLIPEPARTRLMAYQIQLSHLYGLYDDEYPELHITLAKLEYEHEDQIIHFVTSLQYSMEGQKPVDLEIQGVSCFGSPYRSVNFHVTTSPELLALSKSIADTAVSCGMAYNNTQYEWQYHISIANPAFASRTWSTGEYEEACTFLKDQDFSGLFSLNHIEIWYPVKKDYVVHKFFLKE